MNNQMNAKAQISQDKETILALVTHDLKNPITAGMVATKLLKDKNLSPLNPYQKELVENIAGNYKYMKNLIENLLDRYKVINHEYSINKQMTNFPDLVTSAIEEYRFLFEERSQSVNFSSSVQNIHINIDALEIKRVMDNLITNASSYAPKQSEIKISIGEKEKQIFFSIENQGCRFQSSSDVFKKFCTENNNTKTISVGLGLYISKQIINAHNGSIYMDSEFDKYTRVTFWLPLK